MSGVSKAFPGVRALEGVDLRIDPGGGRCADGRKRRRKSTLIKVMTGALHRDGGEIASTGHRRDQHARAGARARHRRGHRGSQSRPDDVGDEKPDPGRQPRRFGLISWRGARERAEERLTRLNVEHRRRTSARLYRSPFSSWWRSRARSKTTRASSSSTSRPRASTSERNRAPFRVVRELKKPALRSFSSPISLTRSYEISDPHLRPARSGRSGSRRLRSCRLKLIDRQLGASSRARRCASPPRRKRRGARGPERRRTREAANDGALRPSHCARAVVGLSGLLGIGRTEVAKLLGARRGRTPDICRSAAGR